MPSKKNKNSNPYAGWTDPALNDPGLERTLNRFIPPGFGKTNTEEQPEPTATQTEQQGATQAVIQDAKMQSKEQVTDLPPVAPPARPPVAPPAFTNDPMIAPLDATHTASEQKIYAVMYRHTLSRNIQQRHFGFKELSRLTGIRSDWTIRHAIDGLIAKKSIEIVYQSNGDNLGPRYQIYTPREILIRRRKHEIEIDPQSKKIRQINRPPVAPPVAPPVEIAGGPPVEVAGGSYLKRNDLNQDDESALRAVLKSLLPNTIEEEINQAIVEIIRLEVAQIKKWAERAKTPPTSLNYFLECKRRLYAVPEKSTQTKSPAHTGGKSRSTIKRKIETLAAQLRSAHVGDGNYSLADFSEDLKLACVREDVPYDSELINEVLARK